MQMNTHVKYNVTQQCACIDIYHPVCELTYRVTVKNNHTYKQYIRQLTHGYILVPLFALTEDL